MADNKINVGGRLHSIATGNILAGADEILDESKNKKQSEINTETYTLVNEVNAKLSSLSPEQQGALDVATKANKNEANLGYYVCDTEGDSAAKVISNATGYILSKGGCLKVKMTNANTADNATLEINSTGAKPLYYAGKRASSSNSWETGETVEVYYDGTNFYANNIAGNGLGDEELLAHIHETSLAGGKPAIINGVINGQGQWIASGHGFSDCLVVPIIAGETIVVTYSEDVSLINRSFFKSFDADTKEIVFAEGYSGSVSNNGTYRVVTRVAPDDASFFYTAYNRTKIISITVGGVEVYASTPASRLLQEELYVADLSRQALRTSDLTLSVGSNIADKEKITTGYVSVGGGLANSDDWKRIAVDVSNIAAGTKLTFGGFYLGRTGYWAFYRDGAASTDKISNGSYADPQGSSRPVTVEVPEGAVTLYITIFKEGSSTTPEGWNTPYDELTCSRGTTLQPFAPYVKVVTAIKGYALAGTSQGSGGSSGGGGSIIADLPLSPDGAGIDVGYAYIDSLTGAVKVKLSQTEQL